MKLVLIFSGLPGTLKRATVKAISKKYDFEMLTFESVAKSINISNEHETYIEKWADVYHALAEQFKGKVSRGGSKSKILIDLANSDREVRDYIRSLSEKNGYKSLVIYVDSKNRDFMEFEELFEKPVAAENPIYIEKIEDNDSLISLLESYFHRATKLNDQFIEVSGAKKLEIEARLKYLEGKRSKELNAAWRKAVEEGDDRETDALTVATNLLFNLFVEIKEIKAVLEQLKVTDSTMLGAEVASIGHKVKVSLNGKISIFYLCSEIEANPMENKVSVESPIGKAIVGKRVGENIEISLPREALKGEILEIFA